MKLIYLEFYIKNYRKITVLYLLVNVVSQKQKSLISYLVFDYKFLIVFSFLTMCSVKQRHIIWGTVNRIFTVICWSFMMEG